MDENIIKGWQATSWAPLESMHCKQCNKAIGGSEHFTANIEKFNGFFCSEECAKEFISTLNSDEYNYFTEDYGMVYAEKKEDKPVELERVWDEDSNSWKLEEVI